MKSPLFVEFYGLPGCGKSTVSHQVAVKLRADGYIVDEPSYDIDRKNSPLVRKLNKLIIFFSCFVFHNKTFREVKTIVKKNGYFGTSLIKQASNVLQKISVYRDEGYRNIVIWDQGLVQASISLSLKGKINASDNLKNLLHILDTEVQVWIVNIWVDEKVAFERMAQRPTNDSRVEKNKDDDQKHEMMSRFQYEIDTIKDGYGGIVIDGTIDLKKQVEQLTGVFTNVDGTRFFNNK